MQPTLPTPAELEALLVDRLNLSPDQKESFLAPKYSLGNLEDFSDMTRAVERIYTAVKNDEHIGIYADYDCDGIPGAVVLIDLFKKLGVMERVHIYIPDRHDEGYGVSKLGIDELITHHATLMITVDVGITALSQVEYAQSKSVDVIVTDHHAPLHELPKACAIIHPVIGTYCNQHACGAAVAFYLVVAFLNRYRAEFDIALGWEKWLLDLVGFATLSDMVPLVGENRTLALFGLHVMRKTRRIGIMTLLAKNSIAVPTLTESDLTFTLAPRLNAASRMATPMLALELLSTNDPTRARAIVGELDAINNERKVLVAQTVKSALSRLSHRAGTHELPMIVVIGDPTWRPAVLGLVANKLQEKYGRSFFVWGEGGDGSIKGSCRMISEHHAALLFQALPEGMMLHAGGHQAAGGFSLSKEKVHFLEEALNAAIASVDHIETERNTAQPISLPLSTATTRHLNVVRKFAPFGVGNAEPLFLFENVMIESVKMFGKNKEHIEILVRDTTGSATAFTFFADERMVAALTKGNSVSFVGTLGAGWRGGVRIRIQEVR